MKKIIYTVMIMFVLVCCFNIYLVTALEFDNVKVYENTGKYGKISVENWLGLGERYVEYTLTDNTDNCLIDCYAEGYSTLFSSGSLFTDLKFYNRKGEQTGLKESKIYIMEYRYVSEQKPVSQEICDKRGICSYVDIDNITVNVMKGDWVEYDYRTLKPGYYRWRIEGKKHPRESVDWVGVSDFGKRELSEWAWWDTEWAKKKQVDITNQHHLSYSNFSVMINVSYDADMQTDFDDLRFTNSSEDAELDFWLEQKVDSEYAQVWVRLDEMLNTSGSGTNTTIYMYYGNASVSSASDYRGVFPFFDHFDVPANAVNATFWTTAVGSPSVSSSNLTISGGGNERILSIPTSDHYSATDGLCLFTDTNQAHFMMAGASDETPRYGIYVDRSGADHCYTFDGSSEVFAADTDVYIHANWSRFTIYKNVTNSILMCEIEYRNVQNVTGFVDDSETREARMHGNEANSLMCDWVRLRDRVQDVGAGSEPFATFGAEEDVPVAGVAPNLTLVFPTNTTYPNVATLDLNYTVSGDATDCWYFNGTANNTVTCGVNVSSIPVSNGTYVWEVFANNTADLINTSQVHFVVLNAVPFQLFSIVPQNISYKVNFLTTQVSSTENVSSCTANGVSMFKNNDTNYDLLVVFSEGANSVLFNCTDLGGDTNVTNQSFTTDLTNPSGVSATPQVGENFTTRNVTFNCTATDNFEVRNMTLFIDNIVNFTIAVGNQTAGSFELELNMSEGTHNSSCRVSDGSGRETEFGASILFTVNLSAPILNILSPNGTENIGNDSFPVDVPVTLNFTEPNPNTCIWWTALNTTNNTITCGTNSSLTVNNNNTDTFFFWMNDTLGNPTLQSSQYDVQLTFFNLTQTITSDPTTDGSLVTAELIINTSTDIDPTAQLLWNNTWFTKFELNETTIQADTAYIYRTSFTVPTGTGNSSGRDVDWRWNFTLAAGETPDNQTALQQQTVFNFGLDDCSAFSRILLNYSLYNEEDQVLVPNTDNITIDLDISIAPTTNQSATATINFTNSSNNVLVCVQNLSATTTFRLDTQVRYVSQAREPEFHHLQNFTFDNNTARQDILLYDLLTADSTEFLITYKDDNFLPVDNALIDITRKYVAEGVFKTVEVPLTDENGQAIGHFDRDNVVYTIIIRKEGVVLDTFNDVVPFCDDPTISDCRINLNSLTQSDPGEDWLAFDGMSYNFNFNESGRQISLTFSTTGGGTSLVSINGTRFDRFGNQTICGQQVTSSSGTLMCSVAASFGNVTVEAELWKDGELIETRYFTLDDDPQDVLGLDGVLMVFILFLTLAMMFVTDTIGVLIGGVLGLIVGSLLLLYEGGSIIGTGSAIMWLIIAILIVAWKIGKRRSAL